MLTTLITMTGAGPETLQYLTALRQASGRRRCSGIPIVTAGGEVQQIVNFCLSDQGRVVRWGAKVEMSASS